MVHCLLFGLHFQVRNSQSWKFFALKFQEKSVTLSARLYARCKFDGIKWNFIRVFLFALEVLLKWMDEHLVLEMQT